jgi:chromosomal replication initiator protein
MRRDKTHVSSGRAFPPEILVYPFIPEEPKTARPTIAEIQALIAKEFLISVGDLKSRRRERPVVWPRQIAMYLCKEATLFSLPVIGRHFGDRDHTTVLHACEKVGTTVRGSAAFALDIVILLEKLTGRAQ